MMDVLFVCPLAECGEEWQFVLSRLSIHLPLNPVLVKTLRSNTAPIFGDTNSCQPAAEVSLDFLKFQNTVNEIN